MKYKISKNNSQGKRLTGEITLPPSKSISNRLLIIRALCNNFTINNLSQSDDTKVLEDAFRIAMDTQNLNSNTIDTGHSGTAMRFLTAFLSNKEGEWILTGSEEMKNRPVGTLVNALKQLGANIEYPAKQGFPPLKIKGTQLNGGVLEIEANISSQFISALLLIAPTLPDGLTLKLKNKVISTPYIHLTLKLMNYFGIKSVWNHNVISIPHNLSLSFGKNYKAKGISVEADWSAASYWYEMAALADEVDLTIYGLNKESLQGDAIIVKLFERLGVKTTFLTNGIKLSKQPKPQILAGKIFALSSDRATLPARHCVLTGGSDDMVEFDFTDYPDLAQTFAVTLSMLNIPFKLSGLESLQIKETNRIKALKKELLKLGINLTQPESGILEWKKSQLIPTDTNKNFTNIEIQTYKDHRMAMAFAPIAIKYGNVVINEPEVVSKSYPDFWNDMKKVGFSVQSVVSNCLQDEDDVVRWKHLTTHKNNKLLNG